MPGLLHLLHSNTDVLTLGSGGDPLKGAEDLKGIEDVAVAVGKSPPLVAISEHKGVQHRLPGRR